MMLSFDVQIIFKCMIFCFIIVKGKQVQEEIIVRNFCTNVTLPCYNTQNEVIRWDTQGKISEQILSNGDLFLTNVQKNDSGFYQCSSANRDEVLSKIRLNINTPPAALRDVIVIPYSVYALIRWQSEDDGGYSITNITVGYKEVDATEWHYFHHHVQSHNVVLQRKVEIFELKPNSSYLFQIWATNKLGRGDITNVTAKTLHDNREIELARHLLKGVKTFDARIWLVAITVMIATLFTLTIGVCLIACCDWQCLLVKRRKEDPERIELIPNIIVNPGCGVDVSSLGCQNTDEDDEEMTTVYFACRNGAKTVDV